MQSILFHYFILWRPLGYFFIFLGLLIEGDLILFTAAFLTHQGFFDFGDMLFVVLVAVFIGDILWYFGGSRLKDTLPSVHAWTDRLAKPFDQHLFAMPLRSIFISKFTYGLHRAIQLRAGMLGIPFSQYLKADFLAGILWICIIGGIGYGASASFVFARHYVRVAEIALVFGLIIFFVLLRFISRFLKRDL